MQTAATLVHKGAMQIAIPAVESFSRHFAGDYHLRIHSDGSLDAADIEALLRAAEPMPTVIVTPEDRAPALDSLADRYPKTRTLLARGAYFTKLQLPVCEKAPYFYFDSDIVWLRRATNLTPPSGWNAFSTESWSWYFGVSQDREWIRAGTPRRVNSGFYYLAEPFPAARMEEMLEKRMFDPGIPYNTDQEIMAYLYPRMRYYHPEDLKRTRVGAHYDLSAETCAALHFPGKMWLPHMDQIDRLSELPVRPDLSVRYQDSLPLSGLELARMRLYMKLANSPGTNLFRKIRRSLRS